MFWPLVFESSVLVFFIKISLVYMIIQVRRHSIFFFDQFLDSEKKRIVILKANVIRFPTCAKSFPSGLELRQLILRGLLQDYYWALRALFPNFHWMTMTNMPTCRNILKDLNAEYFQRGGRLGPPLGWPVGVKKVHSNRVSLKSWSSFCCCVSQR